MTKYRPWPNDAVIDSAALIAELTDNELAVVKRRFGLRCKKQGSSPKPPPDDSSSGSSGTPCCWFVHDYFPEETDI